jgi:hypothetical protein
VPGGGAIAASPIGCLPLDIPGRVKADALATRTAKDYGKDAATLKDVLGRFPIKSLGPSTFPRSAMQAHKARHGESVVVHRLWNTRRGFHTAISPCTAKEDWRKAAFIFRLILLPQSSQSSGRINGKRAQGLHRR